MFKTCSVLKSFKHDKKLRFVQLFFISVTVIGIFKYLKSQVIFGNLAEDIKTTVDAFLVLISSSASLERSFSTLGFVHDRTRNRPSIACFLSLDALNVLNTIFQPCYKYRIVLITVLLLIMLVCTAYSVCKQNRTANRKREREDASTDKLRKLYNRKAK